MCQYFYLKLLCVRCWTLLQQIFVLSFVAVETEKSLLAWTCLQHPNIRQWPWAQGWKEQKCCSPPRSSPTVGQGLTSSCQSAWWALIFTQADETSDRDSFKACDVALWEMKGDNHERDLVKVLISQISQRDVSAGSGPLNPPTAPPTLPHSSETQMKMETELIILSDISQWDESTTSDLQTKDRVKRLRLILTVCSHSYKPTNQNTTWGRHFSNKEKLKKTWSKISCAEFSFIAS